MINEIKAYLHAVSCIEDIDVYVKEMKDGKLTLKSNERLGLVILWDFGQYFGYNLQNTEYNNGELGRWIEYVFEEEI